MEKEGVLKGRRSKRGGGEGVLRVCLRLLHGYCMVAVLAEDLGFEGSG